jgi:hypothetical protein
VSDLQCPAIVVLAATGHPARDVGPHVAGVYDLGGVADGPALRARVEALADLHRGDTIVVVAEAAVIRDALGRGREGEGPVAVAIDSAGWTVLDRAP